MEFGLTSVASYWHLHLPQGQASAYKGSSIDHGLSADAIEASAVLQEDSRPQAILKLRPPNSLDYSTLYGCQPMIITIMLLAPTENPIYQKVCNFDKNSLLI